MANSSPFPETEDSGTNIVTLLVSGGILVGGFVFGWLSNKFLAKKDLAEIKGDIQAIKKVVGLKTSEQPVKAKTVSV